MLVFNLKKIVVLGVSLTDDHKKRLSSLGELIAFPSPTSSKEFVSKSIGADVIYSNGDYLLDSLPLLKNVFVTYPFVEIGLFNSEELKKKGVFVANARGGNKDSVTEWTMYMILSLFRKFYPMVRAKESFPFELQQSLNGKKVLVVGHGVIGSKVGELCEAFGMVVSYLDKGNDLVVSSKDADLIVNSLNCNSTSKNLLDEKFFMGLKKGAYFVTFSRPFTYAIDGLIKAINTGIIAGAGIDCDPEEFGDTTNAFYQKVISNPKILVTPHIAFSTQQASVNGKEMAVKNIEAFLVGKPQNILEKK